MSNSYYPSFSERADLNDYPHIDMAGRQFVKEIEYQMFDNPQWRESERAWWGAMRNAFLATVLSYEDAVKEAYLRGVAATHTTIFGDENEI